MGTRRISRELALQILFYADISSYDNNINFTLFCECFPPKKKDFKFFKQLVEGVWKNQDNIDLIIKKHSANWKMHRIVFVDRNILRIATFEILYCDDIPNRVSINEAVEIGKQFGTEESGAFINGILDSIYIEISKQNNNMSTSGE